MEQPPTLPARPSRSHRVAAGAVSLLATCVLLAACGKGDKPAAGGPGAGGGAPPPLPVAVLVATPKPVPVMLEAVGRTEGSREVEIRARVSGILQKQLYREGEPVAAGAPLYRIDPAPFEIALAQARAVLAQERARFERAQLEARRLKQLTEDRAISQREYDDAISNQRLLEAALLAAEARVREAELNLSYTNVNAPIAGITGRTLRSEGSLVTANTDSSLLTTLTQADPIWVRFSLSEPEYLRLRSARGSGAVSMTLPDGTTVTGGRLNFAGSTVDTRLGTVQLRAEFPNRQLAMLPGQYVRARVEAGTQDGVLVPQQAVLQGDQGRFVWTIGEDGKAAPRPVEAAGWLGGDWVIRSGLKAGDRVIVDNLIKVRPGAPVQPKPAAGAAPADKPAGPAPAAK